MQTARTAEYHRTLHALNERLRRSDLAHGERKRRVLYWLNEALLNGERDRGLCFVRRYNRLFGCICDIREGWEVPWIKDKLFNAAADLMNDGDVACIDCVHA